MNIAAIMPCRGRAEQTVANVRRLLVTAGYEDWRLICVVSRDESALVDMLLPLTGPTSPLVVVTPASGRMTYWRALESITGGTRGDVSYSTDAGATWTSSKLGVDAPLIVNLANDLLPGQHWLKRAVEAYREMFGAGDGMLGFNDGHHEVGHSCHFLISRALLDHYGGWPTWYDHNYGDTELCQRAIADGVYAKAPWAVLYHDHPYFGGADDAVYVEGRAQEGRDRQLYEQRRRAGWPALKR